MAGTLIVNEKQDWLPASWVFDNVLESIAEVLVADEPQLAQEFLDARTTVGMGYLDLRAFPREQFISIMKSAQTALQKAKNEGPSVFQLPSYYPGYISHFENLCSILLTDPRASAC